MARQRDRTTKDSGLPRGVRWVLVAFLAVQLPFIFSFQVTGDEALIWQWSRHLDWGYIDQSPLTAWLVWLSTQGFGDTAFAIRLPGLLCGIGTIWAFVRLSLELFDSPAIAFWTAVAFAVLPIVQATSSMAIVDGEMIFFLGLAGLAFVAAVRGDRVGSWLAVGLWVGLAGLSKLTGLLGGVAGLAALAATPSLRPYLRTAKPYLAVGVALIVFSPVLYWNTQHDWLNLRFTFTTRHPGSVSPMNPVFYVGDQMLPLTPFLWWIAIAGVWKTWRAGIIRQSPAVAVVWWLAAIPLLVFGLSGLLSRGGAHWPAPGLMFALVLGVPQFVDGASCLKRGFFHAAWGLAAAGSIALHGAVFFLDRIAEMRVQVRGNESSSDLKALFGLEAIGPRVLAERERVASSPQPPSSSGAGGGGRREPFLITPNHVFAAQFSFYAPGHPMVYRFGKPDISGRDYERWQRYDEWKGCDAVFFHDGAIKGGRLDKLSRAFNRVELAEPLPIRVNGKVVRTWYLARCYGFRKYPWPEYLENPVRR